MNHIILLHDFNPLNAYGFNSLIFSRSYTAYMQESQVDSVLIFGFCQFDFHQLSLQLPLQPNNPYIKQYYCYMRLNMISWIINTAVWVINWSQRLRQITQTQRFDKSWHHVRTKFYCYLILHFLNNLQKTLWEPNMEKEPWN